MKISCCKITVKKSYSRMLPFEPGVYRWSVGEIWNCIKRNEISMCLILFDGSPFHTNFNMILLEAVLLSYSCGTVNDGGVII